MTDNNKMIPGPEATKGTGTGRFAICPVCRIVGRLGIEILGREYLAYVDGCRCKPTCHPIPQALETDIPPIAGDGTTPPPMGVIKAGRAK